MSEVYDCAVVGCGPAGLAAALNLTIRNKTFVILGTKVCSPKLAKAERIDNYLGMPSVSGEDLRNLFLNHIDQMGIPLGDDRITAIYPIENGFALTGSKNEYQAKTIILATGVHIDRPLPGEEEFLGRGVSYCATCDGPLFKGKTVALLDYTQGEGWDEAKFLGEITSATYYLPLRGQKPIDNPLENINILQGKPAALKGKDTVTSLVLENQEVNIDGVFIIRETQRADVLLPGLSTHQGAIQVDESMATNIPGAYAAGDCTGKPYQLAKAIGQGAIAALSAVSYLDSK